MKEKKKTQTPLKARRKSTRRSTAQKNTSKINASNALFAIVVVLIGMSAVQVFQTQQLLNAVSEGSVKVGTQQQGGGGIGLPSQVGGCG